MAIAAPRPLAEPVTRATLLSRRKRSRAFCMMKPMYVGWVRVWRRRERAGTHQRCRDFRDVTCFVAKVEGAKLS